MFDTYTVGWVRAGSVGEQPKQKPPVLFNKTGGFCFSAEPIRCLNLMCLEVIADLVDGLGQNVRVFFPGINR